jgi:hypothetical protein
MKQLEGPAFRGDLRVLNFASFDAALDEFFGKARLVRVIAFAFIAPASVCTGPCRNLHTALECLCML